MEYSEIQTGAPILVLNSDYNPINITSYRRAVCLVIKNKVQILSKRVVRLLKYVRLPYSRVMANRPSRSMIFRRDGHKCAYCRATEQLTIDHIMPTSRGGAKETWENQITSCLSCNLKKGNRTPQEAGMKLLFNAYIPFNNLSMVIENSNQSEWKEYLFS
jgi:5-methylcytosine-specific restriction endonuclease McrA